MLGVVGFRLRLLPTTSESFFRTIDKVLYGAVVEGGAAAQPNKQVAEMLGVGWDCWWVSLLRRCSQPIAKKIILFRTIDKVLYGALVGWVERQRNPTKAGC